MSSFVVEDETINKIVAWLELDTRGPRQIARYILNEHGYHLDMDFVAERLADEMFQLNVEAVDARYGEGEAAKFRPLDFKYTFHLGGSDSGTVNMIQALKSLQCLTYQCAEGNVPESPLYQMLRDIEFAICRHLVNSMPEYAEAPWG